MLADTNTQEQSVENIKAHKNTIGAVYLWGGGCCIVSDQLISRAHFNRTMNTV